MFISAFLTEPTALPSSHLTGAIFAFTIFLLAKSIYRVTFHPLAKFPGPRWAALTSLYGALYDLHPYRSYCKEFPALHDKYGLTNLILVNERIFKMGGKFDKHALFYSNPLVKGGFFAIPSSKDALARRSMHSPHLSKEAVRRSEHLVGEMLSKFIRVLSAYASEGKAVDLSKGLRCLAADIVMNYTFQRPLNALDAEGFDSAVLHGLEGWSLLFQWPTYFPRLFAGISWGIACLPKWVIRKFVKPFAAVYCMTHEHQKVSREQITHLRNGSPSGRKIHTVFENNVHPNLEKGQFAPTIDEMTSDAFVYLIAGMDTVAASLGGVTWALLNNPQTLQRLETELKSVMPKPHDTVDWAVLENLTYLRAVIKEGLRLSYGVPGRLPRVVPPSGAILCGQEIPAGTLVCSCAYVYHQDPHTFKDPETFQPERWLSASSEELKEMDSKLMPFSKGSRSCIGINLAHAELHLVLSHFLRRFEISNAGTSAADMEWDDQFNPVTRGHLKVMLKERAD